MLQFVAISNMMGITQLGKSMDRMFCLFLTIFLTCLQAQAQVIFGTNNYTQYHVGNLPVIISAPHGGAVAPATIPDRTCNSPTTVTDGNTIQLARQIDTAFFNLTGCRPHIIVCNLRRTKVDCNRNIADGACGNIDAENAWNDFQHFIDTAQTIAQNQFGSRALYIDLHGHGKQPYRLEFGYGLSGNAFNNTDATLNTAGVIAGSSIENLVNTNMSGSTHAELLRGQFALGTLFANAGYPSVPSQQSPTTGGFPYFSGGYNTFNHTCIASGNNVDGFQLECDSAVRINYVNRRAFADSTAKILSQFLMIHRNMDLLTNCGIATVLPTDPIRLHVNPVDEQAKLRVRLKWQGASESSYDYFAVERSKSSIDWEILDKVDATGNSTPLQEYEYFDEFPLSGVAYYRLRQTDMDGHFSYSQVSIVNVGVVRNQNIEISPNPADDFVSLSTENVHGGCQVIILDLFGRVVLEYKNQNRIDVSSLQNGIYLVRVVDEEKNIFTAKMLKQ